MRLYSLNSWLPSRTVLDTETEQQFCTQMAEQNRRATTQVIALGLVVLLVFVLMDVINGGQWFSCSNLLRYASMLCVIILLWIGNHQNVRFWYRNIYLGSLWMMGMVTALFVEIGLSGGKLYEGGPMVAVMMTAAIPALHLGHKLVIWTILALGLVLLNQISNVDTEWTLFYFAMTVLIMAFMQYQIDRLTRLQFRSNLLEKAKAETDQLTGVLNRHAFTRITDKILHELHHDEGLALAIIDLDYFKRYNDYFGHLQGDLALVSVGQRLASLPAELVVRFGGEEFICYLPDCNNAVARGVLNQLRTRIATLPLMFSGHNPCITVSVGYSATQAGEPFTHVIKQADIALYEAKRLGRNGVIGLEMLSAFNIAAPAMTDQV